MALNDQFLECLDKKKDYPLVEVVMLTGDATIDSAIEAMKSGAFDYLVKPFEIVQVIDKIKAAV